MDTDLIILALLDVVSSLSAQGASPLSISYHGLYSPFPLEWSSPNFVFPLLSFQGSCSFALKFAQMAAPQRNDSWTEGSGMNLSHRLENSQDGSLLNSPQWPLAWKVHVPMARRKKMSLFKRQVPIMRNIEEASFYLGLWSINALI